tara:strand:- start:18301 stop:18975 length:675 start_codon:yes stop_codon:yes gene_type:complete
MTISIIQENVNDFNNDYIDDSLDDSWINEQQLIQNIEHNYKREPMDNISIYSVFINSNKNIDKIINSEISLSVDSNNIQYIPKDTIHHIIKNNKLSSPNNYQYQLVDIASFFIDLEPNFIQPFSKTNDIKSHSQQFFKLYPIIENIIVPKSIFIFHKLNSIYFIYQEIVNKPKKYTIKSILKTNKDHNNKFSNTKKVKIDISLNKSYKTNPVKHKKTRKHKPSN